MKRDVVRRALYYGLHGGIFSVIVDFDHFWWWILKVPPPISFVQTHVFGRPFHTLPLFIAFAVLYSLWCVALDRRWNAFVVRRQTQNTYIEIKHIIDMTLIIITHYDPLIGLEFMIQRMNEPEIYRVTNLMSEDSVIASVFCGDNEIFNCNSPDVFVTLNAYLRRRFSEYKISMNSDFST